MPPPTPLEVVQHRISTSLVDLPPELFTAICAFVPCPTVARCRLVCRRLRDVIDASLELQYHIELVRDGMIDGGLSQAHALALWQTQTHAVIPHLTISDRLARLRQLRKAWKTLSWTRCVTVPMPGPCCAYELVGGVFCKTQPTVRPEWRGGGAFGSALGGWPGVANGNGDEFGNGGDGDEDGDQVEDQTTQPEVVGLRAMSATWLPGTHDRQGRTVVRDDVGIPTRDFAMDPSQDLMVLFRGREDAGLQVEYIFPDVLELHVRTISTNQTHPEARVPVLCTPVLYPVTSMSVQIVDDVVGMLYCVDPVRMTIWNWKTGHLVVDRASGNLRPGTWDFSFIHSRALFVTTSNGSGSLELFTFTCDRADADADADSDSSSPSPFQAQPVLHHTTTPTSPLIHVATLHLPPVLPSARVLSVDTHTGPFLAACPPDSPFVASNDARIHVLTVQYMHVPTVVGSRMRAMSVFVHHRVLEQYLERGAASASARAREAMEVPWSEWGPTHARMLPHLRMFQWLRYVHGQRVVILLPTSKEGRCTLQVLDFNVRRALNDDNTGDVAYHAGEGKEGNEDEDGDTALGETTLERVDYPTHIYRPNIFVDVVESGLPYREARRDVRGDYSGVMIDDERLVGFKNPAFLTGDMKEIDVFMM